MDNNEEAVKALWGICHGMSLGFQSQRRAVPALGMRRPVLPGVRAGTEAMRQ